MAFFIESNRENAFTFQIAYEKKLKVWPTQRVIFSHRILDHASVCVCLYIGDGWMGQTEAWCTQEVVCLGPCVPGYKQRTL